MKKLVVAISLFIIILLVIFFLPNINKDHLSDETLILKDGLKTFTEKTCVDNFGNKTCVEKTYVECGGETYTVPGPTGFAVYDKIYINQSVEKEIPKEILMGKEKPSPLDRIKDSDLNLFNNKIIINIKNPKWRKFIDSNSMDPLIDKDTITIEINPKNPDEIHVGDIIAYNTDSSNITIAHRVVYVGNDMQGIYFITKADNYLKNDTDKVRFSQVEGIVVGILY
tara:strand:+ start:315 stop:989 length:675 start_codon:yes stop_codon:yes gene_type:complete